MRERERLSRKRNVGTNSNLTEIRGCDLSGVDVDVDVAVGGGNVHSTTSARVVSSLYDSFCMKEEEEESCIPMCDSAKSFFFFVFVLINVSISQE